MAEQVVEVRFDADLDIWVIDGGPAGPAGVASWEAGGVYWAVDRIDPERLVRAEVDSATDDRTVQLVELLAGKPVCRLLTGSGPAMAPRRLPLGGGAAAVRAAGWLAVTLDELEPGPAGPSLLVADALLLSRRVGIDDLLPLPGADEVAAVVDALDHGFLDELRADDPTAFDLLRAYGAVLRSAGEAVDPRLGGPVEAPELPEAGGAPRPLVFMGIERSVLAVWCQGLPVGAVEGTRSELVRGRRRVQVGVTVGDRPVDALHVQALRAAPGSDGDAYVVVGSAPCEPTARRGELAAELGWLGTGAELVRLTTEPDVPPPVALRPAAEALHWGREAVRLARRATVSEETAGWLRAAIWWRLAGEERLADQAATLAEAPVALSGPFLRDRASPRLVLERLLERGPATPTLADTAQLLGYADLGARARLASAAALLAGARSTAASVEVALARRDFARLGDSEGVRQATELAAAIEAGDR